MKYRKVHCHAVSNFFGCRVPFTRKSTVRGKISPSKDSRRGLVSDDKGSFACARGREWPTLPATKTFGLYALLLKNPARHDFAAKLALLGRI